MDETTPVPPTSTPAAGWYPDPLNGDQLRWWSGQGWSEHTQLPVPVATPAYAPPVDPPPAYQPPAYPQPAEYAPMSNSGAAYSPLVYTAVDPRSEPLPGASIGQAFVRFWTRYAVFTGRASRSEYWWWTLIQVVVYLAVVAVAGALPKGSPVNLALDLLFFGWALAIIVPSYALLARRLHDSNLSAWNILWSLLPFAGGIVMLVFMCRPSDRTGARFDA